MKKLAILGLLLAGSAAWASHTSGISGNANTNGCFGQARAVFVQSLAPGGFGAIASTIKGGMAYESHVFREFCAH